MLQFIEIAMKEAKKSKMDQKHGCVIVYKKKVIAKGYNYHIEDPINYSNLWSIHAEIAAIKNVRKLKIDLTKCDMYVIRLSTKGELKLSKPCDNCMKKITEYNFRNVYYSVHI